MYTSFYNLAAKPFEKTEIPSFFWIGGSRKDLFEIMHNCVVENSGLLLLTGEEGSGKTSMLKALLRVLHGEAATGLVSGPFADKLDLYNAIARSFAIEQEFKTKVQFLLHFSQFLHLSNSRNTNVLLAVDNCHTLSQEILEELRSLENLKNSEGNRLINIFLAGSPEFLQIVEQPNNIIIRQQILFRFRLQPLNEIEIQSYIQHRLEIAGVREPLFTAEAYELLQQLSQGQLSQINTLCERALMLGADQQKSIIGYEIVQQASDPINLIRIDEQPDVEPIAAKRGQENKKATGEHAATDNKNDFLLAVIILFQKRPVITSVGFVLLLVIYLVIVYLPSEKVGEDIPGVTVIEEKLVGTQPTPIKDTGHSVLPSLSSSAEAPDEMARDFWKSRENSSRLTKIDQEDMGNFILNISQHANAIILLRSNAAQNSEKLILQMQDSLIINGIKPAQIKVMKPAEKELLGTIAAIAHQEGHQVMELIISSDGLWWGEILGQQTQE